MILCIQEFALDTLRALWYSKTLFLMAPSPSGKAEVCKISISGSNPLGASTINRSARLRLACFAIG